MKEDRKLTAGLRAFMEETLLTPRLGIAPASRFTGAPAGHRPQDILPGAQSVIVFLLPVLRANLNLKRLMEERRIFPDRAVVCNGECHHLCPIGRKTKKR